MQKRILISIVSFFFPILIVSVLSTESCAAEKFDLNLRLKPGKKYNMRIIREDKISHTMMGQQRDINHSKTMGLGFEVKGVDTNGIASIKVTYQALKEKTTGTGTTALFEYDSTDPCTAVGNPLAPTYTALMGQSFTIRVTPKGEIVELKDLDEMFLQMAKKMVVAEDKLISKVPATTCEKKEDNSSTAAGKAQEQVSDEEKAKKRIDRINKRYGSREKRIEALKEITKNHPLFTEQQIREMVSNVIMPLPAGTVGVGDVWKVKMSLPSMFPSDIDSTCMLKAAERGVVSVDISSKIMLDEKGVPAKKGAPAMEMTGTGSYQGSLQIDETSGWLIRKKTDLRFSGETKSQGTTMLMSMESKIAVEPIN